MISLVAALQALGQNAEIAHSGRWAEIQGSRCVVYVIESTSGGYYTWCSDPQSRTVEFYFDPVQAIQAGLRRAAEPGMAWSSG